MITYTIYLVNYPLVSTEFNWYFTVTILMSCPQPTTFTPSVLTDQEYTITDTSKSFTFSPFNIDPENCAIVYTYSMTDSAIGIVVNSVINKFDGQTRTF